MSIGLELRRRPAWGTPDSQDADRRSRFVDHEVHVIPRSRHEDAAKCWAARCRPPNAGVFNTLGLLLKRQGRADQAKQAFAKAAALRQAESEEKQNKLRLGAARAQP